MENYWIYIDDSGNINLTSKESYFVYGALIFNDTNKVAEFKTKWKNNLQNKFGKIAEKKASEKINRGVRNSFYDIIINFSYSKAYIVANKKIYYRLKEIEYDYNNALKNIQDSNKNIIKRLIKKKEKKCMKYKKLI